MKQLRISKDSTESFYVVERINEFNHSTKRLIGSKQDFLEYLDMCNQMGVLDTYELKVSDDLWAMVINHLQGINQ